MRRARALLALLALAPAALRAQEPSAPLAGRIVAFGMTVADLESAVRFFTEVLDFVPEAEHETADDAAARVAGVFGARTRTATLRLGEERIELTEFLAPRGRPYPADTRGNDRWFQHVALVVSDMDRAYARLRAHGVAHASVAPQTLPAWNENAGGIRAFYFRDPEGHFLELLQFPPGKGEARWQRTDALFLGIDHTAIVVRETEAALAFYQGALGMRVAGASENYGTEQEYLNGVFGARVQITTLRAPTGPAIELLEYLAPGPGRPTPVDLAANDLACWYIRVATEDAAAAFAALRRQRARFVSPGPVEVAGAPVLAVRDPDDHVLRLEQPRAR